MVVHRKGIIVNCVTYLKRVIRLVVRRTGHFDFQARSIFQIQ